MGWRDEAVTRGDSQKCIEGKCQCIPTCPAQAARVAEFLSHQKEIQRTLEGLRVPPKTPNLQVPEPVKGHVWLCVACAHEQLGPGAHCGYRILLVEQKDLERDSSGRIVKATPALPMAYFRKNVIPEGWEPGQKR